MKKTILFIVSLLLTQFCFAIDEDKVKEFISREFNINNVSIENVNMKYNGNELYLAFNRILDSTQKNYYGIFDRAVLFYETNQILIPLINFNGPVIINTNGNRVFDFSGQEYNYLNFYGWEIEFVNSKNGLTVILNLRQNFGKNVADSISMYFDEKYHQFVSTRNPFNYNYSLNWSDPIIIGLARNGYIASNEFENTIEKELNKLSKADLRLCRNAIYAVHGYRFNDLTLMNYFYQFNWYKPGTIEENSKIKLTPEQEQLKQRIIELEK
jgi:hypothetical protein